MAAAPPPLCCPPRPPALLRLCRRRLRPSSFAPVAVVCARRRPHMPAKGGGQAHVAVWQCGNVAVCVAMWQCGSNVYGCVVVQQPPHPNQCAPLYLKLAREGQPSPGTTALGGVGGSKTVCMWGCVAARRQPVRTAAPQLARADQPSPGIAALGVMAGLCSVGACRACANGALAVWGDGAMRRSGDWAAGGASGGQASTHPVKSLKSPGPVWPSTAVRRPLAGAESSVFST